MAIKWAVASGNWSATTTWNNGTLPADGDIVYLNGFVVNCGSGAGTFNLSQLRNDANIELGIAEGGCVQIPSDNTNSKTFNTDCYTGNNANGLFYNNNNTAIGPVINGNIDCTGGLFAKINGNDVGISINGNITIGDYNLLWFSAENGGRGTTINGDINIAGVGRIIQGNCCFYGASSFIFNVSINDSIGSSAPLFGSFSSNSSAKQLIINGNNIFNSSLVSTYPRVSLSGNNTFSSSQYGITSSGPIDLTISGECSFSNYIAESVKTLNINGTLNCNYSQLCSVGVGTTNIQEGSHITYTQQCPLGWGELNAPADFEFEYAGSGVSTGAYIIVNKNEFQHSYPQPSYVVSGTTYGDSSQFTGTMTQPLESVVLKDYVYDSGTKTGTLDTSNLNVPSDLTQQFDDIYTKLGALQSRLSIADIIQALTQYHAVTEEYIAAVLGEN